MTNRYDERLEDEDRWEIYEFGSGCVVGGGFARFRVNPASCDDIGGTISWPRRPQFFYPSTDWKN
jgi:hypothetical protein